MTNPNARRTESDLILKVVGNLLKTYNEAVLRTQNYCEAIRVSNAPESLRNIMIFLLEKEVYCHQDSIEQLIQYRDIRTYINSSTPVEQEES